jgi:hypothetical protein
VFAIETRTGTRTQTGPPSANSVETLVIPARARAGTVGAVDTLAPRRAIALGVTDPSKVRTEHKNDPEPKPERAQSEREQEPTQPERKSQSAQSEREQEQE